MIYPAHCKKGEKVALIAPAGICNKQQVTAAKRNIASLGLEPEIFPHVLIKYGYFSAPDKQRADDLMRAFSRDDIKAVFCVRGGYGSARLQAFIDKETIRSNPKPFFGFSDITALLQFFQFKTGMVSFHAPMGISSFPPFTVQSIKQNIFENQDIKTLNATKNAAVISGGNADGFLTGGNLAVLASLIGTKWDFSWENHILLLEEIGEEPYRIDRMLSQLKMAGKFDKLAGIALGQFAGCEAEKPKKSFSLYQVLKQCLGSLNIPVVHGFPFGHVDNNACIPLGVKARLEADKKQLHIFADK